jgi:hypothetical protein
MQESTWRIFQVDDGESHWICAASEEALRDAFAYFDIQDPYEDGERAWVEALSPDGEFTVSCPDFDFGDVVADFGSLEGVTFGTGRHSTGERYPIVTATRRAWAAWAEARGSAQLISTSVY